MQRHGVSASAAQALTPSALHSKALHSRVRPYSTSSAVPAADSVCSDYCEGAYTPFPACQAPWQSTKQERQDNNRSMDAEDSGELIFNLYNRGSGWGEEIIPHITVTKRTVAKKQQRSWQVRRAQFKHVGQSFNLRRLMKLPASFLCRRIASSWRTLPRESMNRAALD